MDPRFSLKQYPRADTAYKAKSSYNFEAIKARVYMDRKTSRLEPFTRWLIHGLIGILVGSIAFFMFVVEEFFAVHRAEITQHMISTMGTIEWAYVFWTGTALVFALIGVIMTVYYGPFAAGSGVPEVMAMLNGIQGGGATHVASLITKSVGVVCAVLGNLCVGKEGPMVHIGSICGFLIPHIPFDMFAPFRNDHDKRTFMAAGCSAGVAAAFGAPIGGTLFSYEISKPNTFWTFGMLWRIFFSCAVSVFFFGFLEQLYTGSIISLSNSGALKFGAVNIVVSPLSDGPAAILIGVVCGLLGALFIAVYSNLMVFRKYYINTNFRKILEVALLSLATSSAFYWLAAFSSSYPTNCKLISDLTVEPNIELYAFTCPPETYNSQTT
jgi:chloride channel 7